MNKLSAFLLPVVTVLVLGAASLWQPGEAMAQDSEQQAAIDIKQAKEYFLKGSSFFEEGKFAAASEAFLKSYDLSKNALLLFNVAKSYQEMEDYEKAKTYYLAFKKAIPNAENMAEVEEQIAKIDAILATLSFPFSITSADDSVYAIYLDDIPNSVCSTPCELELSYGPHKVYARDQDNVPRLFAVDVTTAPLEPIVITNSKNLGMGTLSLQVDDTNLLESYSVGDLRRDASNTSVSLTAGRHPLTVTTNKFRWSTNVLIFPNQTTQVDVMLSQLEEARKAECSWMEITSYVTMGSGAGLLGGALYLGIATRNMRSRLKKFQASYANTDFYQSIERSTNNQRLAANILYAAGGSLVAAGITLLIIDLFDKPEINSGVLFSPSE